MAYKELKTRIKWCRDTSANWTSNDPVLLDGEIIVVDTDSGETRFKIGDGVKTYTQLPFEDEVIRNLINNTFEAALPKSGGTMTGSLILSADPAQDLEASTKQYVDNKVLTINASIEELSTDVAYINSTNNENITDIETGVVPNAVLYTAQTLTEAQQTQARENIGAASIIDVDNNEVYILKDGETLDDVPETVKVVYDPSEVSEIHYFLAEADKIEIAQMAANLVDTSLLDIIGVVS